MLVPRRRYFLTQKTSMTSFIFIKPIKTTLYLKYNLPQAWFPICGNSDGQTILIVCWMISNSLKREYSENILFCFFERRNWAEAKANDLLPLWQLTCFDTILRMVPRILNTCYKTTCITLLFLNNSVVHKIYTRFEIWNSTVKF